ncbi:MAG TPA: DUF6479 family protein [Streptomyces sp.]|uniref:DUF6479 family protein n=1 Tax=Streptomyces sp. TaxID=1931 RepID=UPI002D41C6C9|nr:DUF6479 family protein [Streptomyces sp.]HZG06581.1 DUF6479 family protein [Streptomyces sp.]
MNGTHAADDIPLAASDLTIGIGPFVAGLVVAALLILAVVYGLRLLNRGDEGISTEAGPRPENPRGYEDGIRDDEPIPTDGRRRYPHELQEHEDTRPSSPDERRTWNPGSSGGFGSGGPGHT